MEDIGSGCLVDLRSYGISDEPLRTGSLRAGVDLICFSGDKLLGGPQAGIIAGARKLVEPIRKNPLMRTYRVEKLIYGALEATLQATDSDGPHGNPGSAHDCHDEGELAKRAREAFPAG